MGLHQKLKYYLRKRNEPMAPREKTLRDVIQQTASSRADACIALMREMGGVASQPHVTQRLLAFAYEQAAYLRARMPSLLAAPLTSSKHPGDQLHLNERAHDMILSKIDEPFVEMLCALSPEGGHPGFPLRTPTEAPKQKYNPGDLVFLERISLEGTSQGTKMDYQSGEWLVVTGSDNALYCVKPSVGYDFHTTHSFALIGSAPWKVLSHKPMERSRLERLIEDNRAWVKKELALPNPVPGSNQRGRQWVESVYHNVLATCHKLSEEVTKASGWCLGVAIPIQRPARPKSKCFPSGPSYRLFWAALQAEFGRQLVSFSIYSERDSMHIYRFDLVLEAGIQLGTIIFPRGQADQVSGWKMKEERSVPLQQQHYRRLVSGKFIECGDDEDEE